MKNIKNSIIDSSLSYLEKLEYLAINDKKTADDLILLDILNDIYDLQNKLN